MKKLLLIVLLLVGCSNKNDINKFKEEYEALNDSNIEVNIDTSYNIKYLNIDEVVTFLENDTGILLFGITNDGMTRAIIEILLKVAKDNKLDLYYYNPSEIEESETFAKMPSVQIRNPKRIRIKHDLGF